VLTLILATGNSHKLREFRRLLPDIALEPLPKGIYLPPEDGDSFSENALIKARAVVKATGKSVIADDSGIEAEELNGAPGIFSARFAGQDATDEQNLNKLFTSISSGSKLRYVCVIAHVNSSGEERLFKGTCEGFCAKDQKGKGGFGYDPIFIPKDRSDQKTMAELSDSEKDQISHRGRAARRLAEWLVTSRR
jgi:XTP/dITP diphosphohydrolase